MTKIISSSAATEWHACVEFALRFVTFCSLRDRGHHRHR